MSSQDFTKGNSRLPPPADAASVQSSSRKRLVVLCDGTTEDSVAGTAQYPTNITRISRALSPNAWIPTTPGGKDYIEVEQIVYYEPGPGAYPGSFLLGAPFGTGLSELVRAAYGFLADNYNEGDTIAILGFSRGAYVARSIAGLIANHGLLNKRGMDNFHVVYNSFYNINVQPGADIVVDGRVYSPESLGLRKLQRGTVEVVAVFDTVAFHNPVTAFLNRIFRCRYKPERDKDEMPNTTLSPNIKFAFHAISLDESRIPYQVTLWFQPIPPTVTTGAGDADSDTWTTVLEQVWFSGGHSDVGGGKTDSRLSDIALAWMISQLVHNKLLEFDQNYLLSASPPASDRWATALGVNNDPGSAFSSRLLYAINAAFQPLQIFLAWILRHIFCARKAARAVTGERTPGRYVPVREYAKRDAQDKFQTNECFHDSVNDRQLVRLSRAQRKGTNAVYWPSRPLRDFSHSTDEGGTSTWTIPRENQVRPIMQRAVSTIESFFKGRIRDPGTLSPITSADAVAVSVSETPPA